MSARRGFTLIELAVVISVSALLVPLVYLLGRNFDDQRAVGLRQLAVADEVRTVGEALRADRRSLRFPGRAAWCWRAAAAARRSAMR